MDTHPDDKESSRRTSLYGYVRTYVMLFHPLPYISYIPGTFWSQYPKRDQLATRMVENAGIK